MSSAQRDLQPLDDATVETEAAAPPFALKEQVAQRLAAHRARRYERTPNPVTPIATPSPAKSRSSRIAAAVAERYAQSPSYRSFLAAQAEVAIREAEAAAEVAALSAQAVADAQYQLLAELDQWTLTPPPPPPLPPVAKVEMAEVISVAAPVATQPPSHGLTIRLYEEVSRSAPETTAPNRLQSQAQTIFDEAEGLALDEEIAFRQAPVFEEAGPPVEIPANLIEFPRQLVAARKARPRLAEGPLRDEADHAPSTAQLRIFEVEAIQISTAPVVESLETEWSSILLAAHPAAEPAAEAQFERHLEGHYNPDLRPQTAPLNLRLMAGVVDGCIVTASLLAFITVFAVTVGKVYGGSPVGASMSLQTAAIGTAGTLAVFALLYQLLFFTLAEATPGMRYARIALCTLSDENPTRPAMRRRIFAVLLSACPAGIGFLWAWLDEDSLGWHDRISRMYQRSY